MRKHYNIFLTFIAVFLACACQKTINPNAWAMGAPEYFVAGTIEDIESLDLTWSDGNKVNVMSAHKGPFTYGLVDGTGTKKGRFGSAVKPDFGSDNMYFALYPDTLVGNSNGSVLVWPDEQTYTKGATPVVPMCCAGDISGTDLKDGTFYCLGGIISVNISIPDNGASFYVNKMVMTSADAIAGEFSAQAYDSDYCRVARIKSGTEKTSIAINFMDGDNQGIYLEAGNTYNCIVAVPESPDDGFDNIVLDFYEEGDYQIGHIEYGNAVVVKRGEVASVDVSLMVDITDYGIYSVSDTKKVKFAKGNLYVKKVGDKIFYGLEPQSHDLFEEKRTEDHTNTFFWDKNIMTAIASEYKNDDRAVSDIFFSEDPSTPIDLCGKTWRVLTSAEWDYLLNKRTMSGGGVRYVSHDNGLRIYPDDYKDGDKHVTLPHTCVLAEAHYGFYWTPDTFTLTKSAIGDGPLQEEDHAVALIFYDDPVNPGEGAIAFTATLRNKTCAIRLVTEAE